MASIFISADPYSEIDYSLIDGRVRSFVLRGQKLYDEADGTVDPSWEKNLVDLVVHLGFDIEQPHHAFMHWMKEKGMFDTQ